MNKCELCGEQFTTNEDIYSIEETGRCVGCYEEWGDDYPDR